MSADESARPGTTIFSARDNDAHSSSSLSFTGANRRLRAPIRQTTLFLLPSPDYIYVTYGEPHAARGRQMLAAHPELRALAGPFPASAAWTLVLVLAQCGAGAARRPTALVRLAALRLRDRGDDRPRVVGAHPRLLP